jgi:hypothetical protein
MPITSPFYRYQVNGQVHGPVPAHMLRSMPGFSWSCLVAKEGTNEWQPAHLSIDLRRYLSRTDQLPEGTYSSNTALQSALNQVVVAERRRVEQKGQAVLQDSPWLVLWDTLKPFMAVGFGAALPFLFYFRADLPIDLPSGATIASGIDDFQTGVIAAYKRFKAERSAPEVKVASKPMEVDPVVKMLTEPAAAVSQKAAPADAKNPGIAKAAAKPIKIASVKMVAPRTLQSQNARPTPAKKQIKKRAKPALTARVSTPSPIIEL